MIGSETHPGAPTGWHDISRPWVWIRPRLGAGDDGGCLAWERTDDRRSPPLQDGMAFSGAGLGYGRVWALGMMMGDYLGSPLTTAGRRPRMAWHFQALDSDGAVFGRWG